MKQICLINKILVHDHFLRKLMIANENKIPARELKKMVLEDVLSGGKGHANAVLVVPTEQIRKYYLSKSPEERGQPLPFKDTILAGNTAAILEDIPVHKYNRFLPAQG